MSIVLVLILASALCYTDARPQEATIEENNEEVNVEDLKGSLFDFLDEISKTIEDCLTDIYNIFAFMTLAMWTESSLEEPVENVMLVESEDLNKDHQTNQNELVKKEMEITEFESVLPIPPIKFPREPEPAVPDFSS